ncbi:hypothetical protein LDC_1630 [sediment metagenome]|uniref:Uncharacterized protein n=1 Tax=sediment metagenome TaxID=749907 RepID=D9PJC2_9ZZZZ
MIKDKWIETISDKEEINKIISEKIKDRTLIFTDYYYFSIDKKGISHEEVKEIFPHFDKVYAIEIERLKKGDLGYELFYHLTNNTSFSIATCPINSKLLIIHAVLYKRNLEKRIKRFKQ